MPAIMVDPTDLQLKPLPSRLTLLNGDEAQGDLDQATGVKAGWLIPQPIPPVAEGFERTFANPPWRNTGDGTAAPVYHDESQADIDAANAAAAAQAAIDATAANYAAQAASLPARQALATLQAAYSQATNQICQLAGITPVVNVLLDAQAAQAIQTIVAGPNALQGELLGMELLDIQSKLYALQGASALDNIPVSGSITIPTA